MNENIIFGLVNNAALLMALGLVYDTVTDSKKAYGSTFQQAVSGLIIGGIAIVLMATPVRWEPGVIFDTRTILLGLTGLFFGALPTSIAMALAAAYRFSLGGAGVVVGVATIISSGLIGLAWRQFRFRRKAELSLTELYLFGVAVHVAMVLCMLLLPQELIRKFIANLALPVLLIYPVGTALLGMLLANRKRRHLFEEGLRKSEQRFRELFQNITDPVYISNQAGEIIAANRQACRELGYSREELLQLKLADVDASESVDDQFAHNLEILSQGLSITFESAHRRKDGTVFPVELNVQAVDYADQPAVLGVARNISERKQAEEERFKLEQQLLHAQKLESLGVLAGGIAHDFNNILTAIIGNADLALMRVNPESPAVDNLCRIEQAASRAADLAKQMLAYSGKGKFAVGLLDLNSLLEEMLHMLQVSISKKAELRLDLTRSLPTVEADATQMRQIIMNLVINASEALGEAGGVIAITTGSRECDAGSLKNDWLTEELKDGLYVYLEISDSGCGMDRETLLKIFDPFFTTKFSGRGLGMAAVLGIVRGHHGAIKVDSQPGRGSTFTVLLPASGTPVEPCDAKKDTGGWSGSGTVLLVDDEETVRSIGSEMLKELGFTVVTANDGHQALEVFRSAPEISFVILDLTMPRMDGEQCFRELRALDPGLRVIMSSGYNEQEISQKFSGMAPAGFIQKPYKLSELKEVVRNVLVYSAGD